MGLCRVLTWPEGSDPRFTARTARSDVAATTPLPSLPPRPGPGEGQKGASPGTSPSGTAFPQDAKARSRKSSPDALSAILRAETASRRCSRQASVLQRRHRVFPVPVGLSRTPFTF